MCKMCSRYTIQYLLTSVYNNIDKTRLLSDIWYLIIDILRQDLLTSIYYNFPDFDNFNHSQKWHAIFNNNLIYKTAKYMYTKTLLCYTGIICYIIMHKHSLFLSYFTTHIETQTWMDHVGVNQIYR